MIITMSCLNFSRKMYMKEGGQKEERKKGREEEKKEGRN